MSKTNLYQQFILFVAEISWQCAVVIHIYLSISGNTNLNIFQSALLVFLSAALQRILFQRQRIDIEIKNVCLYIENKLMVTKGERQGIN